MAYELVAEVLDHAPSEFTPAERMVMVAIAEYVRTEDYKQHGTRSISRPAADIARRAGLKPEGLKEALQRLAKRKFDVRVPLRTGRDGRPVYAVPGTSPRYEIPPLPVPADCFCDACKRAIPALQVIHKGGSQPPLRRGKGGSQPRLGGATAPPDGVTAPPIATSEDTENVLVEASRNGVQGGATTPPNRVREPGSPGPRARTRAGGRARTAEPTTEDLDTIIEEMNDHAGVKVTRDHARRIWVQVLERAGTKISHPLLYVLAAIRDAPHEYKPTPTPPPVQSSRQLPLVAVASDETRAKVMSQLRAGTA
jgi:hypothetical protein